MIFGMQGISRGSRAPQLLRRLTITAAFLVGAQAAQAQTPDTIEVATHPHACAEDQYKSLGGSSTLGCTANDLVVTATAKLNGNTVQQCPTGTQSVVSILLTLASSSTTRYNVGLFVGDNQNSPQSAGGTCSATIFPNTPTGTVGDGNQWYDNEGDAGCGDYNKNSTTINEIDNVTVFCIGDSNHNLVIPYTLVYGNVSNQVCNSVDNVTAGTSSKCQASTTPIGNVFISTAADPSCTKNLQLSGDTLTTTITISNNSADTNFQQDASGVTFEDNFNSNTPVLTVTNATCGNEQNGAVCGTVNNASGDVTGTITTFPFGSSVDITITATIPPGNTDPYSNSVNLTTPPTVAPPSPPWVFDPQTGNSTYTGACSAQTTLPVKLQSFEVK